MAGRVVPFRRCLAPSRAVAATPLPVASAAGKTAAPQLAVQFEAHIVGLAMDRPRRQDRAGTAGAGPGRSICPTPGRKPQCSRTPWRWDSRRSSPAAGPPGGAQRVGRRPWEAGSFLGRRTPISLGWHGREKDDSGQQALDLPRDTWIQSACSRASPELGSFWAGLSVGSGGRLLRVLPRQVPYQTPATVSTSVSLPRTSRAHCLTESGRQANGGRMVWSSAIPHRFSP